MRTGREVAVECRTVPRVHQLHVLSQVPAMEVARVAAGHLQDF